MIKLVLALTSLTAAVAAAQPPAPRPAPRPVPAPAPAPAPAPVPRAPRAAPLPAPVPEMRLWELEDRLHAATMAADWVQLPDALELRALADEARWAAERAVPHALLALDVEAIADEARAAARAAAPLAVDVEAAAERAVRAWEDSEHAMAVAPLAPLAPVAFGPERFPTRPPAAWARQDPADSLYRLGREAINRGDHRRAAAVFRELAQRHPRSVYAADAAYWEAFARYRIGTEAELRTALGLLDGYLQRTAQATGERSSAARTTRSEAAALATRIRGMVAVTAQSSDEARALAASLSRQAGRTGDGCDREEVAVRVEALNALARIDSASVLPHLRRVLANHATCAAGLRDRAVFLLARQPGAEAEALLVRTAESDPDVRVRASAISWLGRRGGDQSVAVLEQLARSDEERVRAAAFSALAYHDSPRARQVLRAYAERADAPLKARLTAVEVLRRDTTAANAAYLRQLYARADTLPLRETVLAVVARMPGEENAQWLATVARDENAPIRLRREALSGLMRRDLSIAELGRLYDATTLRELREEVVRALGRRKEPEATDRLLAIARGDADPRLRRAAIAALARKDDPRTARLLLEIIDRNP